MSKLKVYIAGPMEGEPDHGYPVFNDMEEWITGRCNFVVDCTIWCSTDELKVINPARNFGGNANLARWVYFEKDIPQVAKADYIILLPGYEKSRGVDLEIRVGIEVCAVFIEAHKNCDSGGNWGWALVEREHDQLKRYVEPEEKKGQRYDYSLLGGWYEQLASQVREMAKADEVDDWRDSCTQPDPYIDAIAAEHDGEFTIKDSGKRQDAWGRDMAEDVWLKAANPAVGVTVEPGAFTIKDSGERQDYASGMRRDTQTGKPDYTLIPLEFLERWAHHMTKGAAKYGRENWRMANSQEELQRFQSSALRHMMQWLRGDRDEDHASAVAFNVAAAEFVLGRLENNTLGVNTDWDKGWNDAWAAVRQMGIEVEEPPF